MTTLTYVRHAKQKYSNHLDPPIIENPLPLGMQFDFIICSPYLRCRQTAMALNVVRKTPIYVDINISEFLGKHNRIGFMSLSSTKYGIIPMNETFDEFDKRLDDHLDYVLSFKNNILIVTHSFNVKLMQIKLTGRTDYDENAPVPYVEGFTIHI